MIALILSEILTFQLGMGRGEVEEGCGMRVGDEDDRLSEDWGGWDWWSGGGGGVGVKRGGMRWDGEWGGVCGWRGAGGAKRGAFS